MNKKIAIYENGDRIQYNEEGKIEWGFSLRYGWNNLPEEVKQEIIKFNLKWDWFGNYISKNSYSLEIMVVNTELPSL
jgi:hypothetical protein